MFKSKMIYDPMFGLPGNRGGLTIGLTFHTPKFHDCKPEAGFASQFDEMRYPRPLDEETLERRFLSWWYHKHVCKKKRHMHNHGYMYWTGPKRRYTFYYMGRDGIRKYQGAKWWQIMRVSKNGRYVRWLDNGPKNKSTVPWTQDDIRLMDAHTLQLKTALDSSRQQMHEYIRVRGFQL